MSLNIDPSLPTTIDVTLLLTGGHQYPVTLQSDDPLLRQLFQATLAGEGDRAEEIFQIPIHKGRAMLSFRGDRLIGLVTDPPIVLQRQDQLTQLQTEPVPLTTTEPLFQDPVLSDPSIYPSGYLQIENFLDQADLESLLKYVEQREVDFVSTTTSTGAADYRKSIVLHHFPEFSELISQRIHQVMPEVLEEMEIPPFQVTQIECQLTAHNDGNYYKIHNDNGSGETATRELTYVYYFYREPKAFTGGELIIYDSRIENNYYVRADSYQVVEPIQNSIVFFLSRYMHEVLPITCPSRKFKDSRFTINGWIRR